MTILLTLNLQIDVSEKSCVFYEDRHQEQQCEALVVLIMEYVISGARSTHGRNKLIHINSPKT